MVYVLIFKNMLDETDCHVFTNRSDAEKAQATIKGAYIIPAMIFDGFVETVPA
jgi:hypothetical protein